jgi:hypothetical protein
MIPDPLVLTPIRGNYRALACPEEGCRWHIHYTDNADGKGRYEAHYREEHGHEHVPA